MKCRKFFAVLLAAVMMLGTAPAFAAEAFTDVAADAYYAEAVNWAVEKEITNGRGDGKFAPEDAVTRAEAVTFLWRMAGRPEPAGTETFADVESDPGRSWYGTAVQWAVDKGITNGTGGGNFSPSVTCTRGMILTMLYRMEDSPFDAAMEAEIPEDFGLTNLDANALVQTLVNSIRSENALPDVPEGAYYELPVIWALFNSIISEDTIDLTTYAVQPDDPCPRGEMVYYLFGASKYEQARAAAEEANKPLDPIETGTVPETVVLDKKGVKITVTGIRYDSSIDEVWLDLTVENGSDKKLNVDVGDLFVNTFHVSSSAFIPVEEEFWTTYSSVDVPAGETKEFNVGLNYLREKDIADVCEVELQMSVFELIENEDGYEYEEYAFGEPVNIRTSLYDENADYDLEGVVVCDEDSLKVLVTKAENDEYMGPQIAVYVCNSGDREVCLELEELKLDGEVFDSFFGITVPAGKRGVDTVYIDFDYENIPVFKKAELVFKTVDTETWEPTETFAPVTVFAD